MEHAAEPAALNTSAKASRSSVQRLRLATILLLASFAALVIVAGTYNLTEQYHAVMDSTTRTARSTMMAVESHAVQTLGETFRIMEGIGDVYRHEIEHELMERDGVLDEAYLHQLMASKLPLAPAVASFFVADEQYRPMAGSRTLPVNLKGVFLSGFSFEAPVYEDGDFIVGKVYKNENPNLPGQTWLLPLGLKVKDSHGGLQGYVFAIVQTKFFSDYYTTLDFGARGHIALWTNDGHLIAAAGNENTPVGELRTPRSRDPVHVITEPAVYRVGGNSPTEVVALSPVGTLPLAVSVDLAAEDFLTPWRNARSAIVLAIIGIVLATAVFGFIILRQIARTEENETALRQAKAAAEEANDAKSRFLAHMSHEFRTPLNAIMGFSEIIKNKVLGEGIAPAYLSYAGHIHRSGEHLLNIVNDILDMAKIESGVQPLHNEAIDISSVITGAVSFIEGLATQKHVRIRVALPSAMPFVSGDQRFSRQVVINLLSNAIKFSPDHGEIVITGRVTDGGALDIAVTDHGPGIEPALLKRLGEPFLQGNPSVSHSGQGTGLGLSICKRYMDLLGGALIIESKMGGGTTATIRFPSTLLILARSTDPVRSVA